MRSRARDRAMRSTTCCGVSSTPSGANVGAVRAVRNIYASGEARWGAARRPIEANGSGEAYCVGASVRSSPNHFWHIAASVPSACISWMISVTAATKSVGSGPPLSTATASGSA